MARNHGVDPVDDRAAETFEDARRERAGLLDDERTSKSGGRGDVRRIAATVDFDCTRAREGEARRPAPNSLKRQRRPRGGGYGGCRLGRRDRTLYDARADGSRDRVGDIVKGKSVSHRGACVAIDGQRRVVLEDDVRGNPAGISSHRLHLHIAAVVRQRPRVEASTLKHAVRIRRRRKKNLRRRRDIDVNLLECGRLVHLPRKIPGERKRNVVLCRQHKRTVVEVRSVIHA